MRAAKVDGLYGDGWISDLILLKMLGWNPRLPVKPSDAPSKVAKSKKNFIAKRFSGPSLPKAKFKLKLKTLISPVHISWWWRGFPKCQGRMMSLGHWSEAGAAARGVTRVTTSAILWYLWYMTLMTPKRQWVYVLFGFGEQSSIQLVSRAITSIHVLYGRHCKSNTNQQFFTYLFWFWMTLLRVMSLNFEVCTFGTFE